MKFLNYILGVAAIMAAGLVSTTAHAQTIYQQPAASVAQLVGGPGAPVNQPTYAATMTIPISLPVLEINANSATSATSTVNAGAVGTFGQLLITIITASGSGTATITFGTNFLPTATAAPTTGKSITVAWVSDGTVWHEFSRSASAQ